MIGCQEAVIIPIFPENGNSERALIMVFLCPLILIHPFQQRPPGCSPFFPSPPHSLLLLPLRTLQCYSLGKFQLYKAVLSTVATVFNIRSSDLIHLVTQSVYPFANLSPFPCPLAPGNHFPFSLFPRVQSLFCFSRFHI